MLKLAAAKFKATMGILAAAKANAGAAAIFKKEMGLATACAVTAAKFKKAMGLATANANAASDLSRGVMALASRLMGARRSMEYDRELFHGALYPVLP